VIELRILQIGDIHYPQAKFDLDYKDKALSAGFAHEIARDALRPVLKVAITVAEDQAGGGRITLVWRPNVMG
jgi:hypothetical protein